MPGNRPDIQFGDGQMPYFIFIRLFFALFGLSSEREVQITDNKNQNLEYYFQIVFASYMLMTTIILINLLIAMMSDTYQRIQQQSDMEWKFGRSKLITSMSKTNMAPTPINLFTSWMTYLATVCKKARKTKVDDYSKFVNESSKKVNGKMSNGKQKMNHLEVPTNFENAERAISQSSFRDPTSIENVTDWKKVIKKYYALIRNT